MHRLKDDKYKQKAETNIQKFTDKDLINVGI